MEINIEKTEFQEAMLERNIGTLAIDLGSSTTVVAFQNEKEISPKMINIKPLCRAPGQIPSIVWHCEEQHPYILVGQEVLDSQVIPKDNQLISKDFKRWIGAPKTDEIYTSKITPEKAGELLIQKIWEQIPNQLHIKRLVLTAPVDTYRSYKNWLTKVCSDLNVSEIALVDEPTAAAMGAGLPPGSKLLVVDIGGSTIDMSIVYLEGGEGRAAPIAELVRFDGKDLGQTSKQVLRTAKVLGKSGLRLGGQDIDRWIVNHLFPDSKQSNTLLDCAEKLKCKLSQDDIKDTKIITQEVNISNNEKFYLKLSKQSFEQLLIEKGFLESIETLFWQTIKSAKSNSCNIEDLNNVVLVGGGAQIPIVKSFLEKLCKPIPLMTPSPVEAVAVGALMLTPGVSIKDVLQKGVSLRCWNQKKKQHIWHPLFMPGQPWPTSKPLEIILGASVEDQKVIELVIGEDNNENSHEIIYVNGIPTIKDIPIQNRINTAKEGNSILINLSPPGMLGDDCIKLQFNINEDCDLEIEGTDLRTNEEIKKIIIEFIR